MTDTDFPDGLTRAASTIKRLAEMGIKVAPSRVSVRTDGAVSILLDALPAGIDSEMETNPFAKGRGYRTWQPEPGVEVYCQVDLREEAFDALLSAAEAMFAPSGDVYEKRIALAAAVRQAREAKGGA